MDLIYSETGAEGLRHREDSLVCRFSQFFGEIVELKIDLTRQAVNANFEHPQSFLESFFEPPADRHDFANGFHPRTDCPGNSPKLLQVPPWNFDHDVIQSWFKTSRSHPGDRVR